MARDCNCTCPIAGAHDSDCAIWGPPQEPATARFNPQGQHEITHLCPPVGSHVMACCGHSPIEMPLWHRLTLSPEMVTCKGEDGSDD